MSQLPNAQIDQLQEFVSLLKTCPAILHDPGLAFFRDYLVSMGARLPTPPPKKEPSKTPEPESVPNKEPEQMEQEEVVEEEPESDVELDMTGVIEPDTDKPQEMGNCNDDEPVELTDEQMDEFNTKRDEAMSAFGEADWQKAIDLFTEAIKINSSSAACYAKRGTAYLKSKRPNACIRDCDRAVKLNPDSAAAHKFRGRAHRLLGHFVEAAKDLRLACKIDFDEVADEWLKEVTPNAKKIEEHERNKQRRKEEKELAEKKERIRKAKEAREKAYEEAKKDAPEGGMPGGMDDMGGLGGLFQDPELLSAFQDPEVAAAFQDISTNPANMAKYQNNPKVMKLINQMMGKFGGGGAPGGMPGMPGMGGGMGGMGGGMPGMGGFPGMGGMPGGMPGGFMPGGASEPPPASGETKSAQPPKSSTDDLD